MTLKVRRIAKRRSAHREPRRVSPYEIPTIADYAHHNEDAARIWWEENRYDMEHPEIAEEARWEEEMERGDRWSDPDPFQTVFSTREEAQAFLDELDTTPEFGVLEGRYDFYVEHYDREAHRRANPQ
jgi:hypothetical protein